MHNPVIVHTSRIMSKYNWYHYIDEETEVQGCEIAWLGSLE